MPHLQSRDHGAVDPSNKLFKASSVFPFDFFPDSISIDKEKIVVTQRSFFLSEHIESVFIKDIQNVVIERAPLFATIIITSQKSTKPILIHHLKAADAKEARAIIDDLITVQKNT